jgi:hypothetical protein
VDSPKIYVAKPLGLVSFEAESDPSKPGHCTVSQWEIRPRQLRRKPSSGRGRRVLFCRVGLAKVGAGRSKKVFLYYDTICWDIFVVPGAIFARQRPFVGQVTYASAQV